MSMRGDIFKKIKDPKNYGEGSDTKKDMMGLPISHHLKTCWSKG